MKKGDQRLLHWSTISSGHLIKVVVTNNCNVITGTCPSGTIDVSLRYLPPLQAFSSSFADLSNMVYWFSPAGNVANRASTENMTLSQRPAL